MNVTASEIFESAKINFGKVSHGDVVDVLFKVVSDDNIQSIVPYCGCTTVKREDEKTITGTLDITRAIGTGNYGALNKTIKVWLDDGQSTHLINEDGVLKENVDKRFTYVNLLAEVVK